MSGGGKGLVYPLGPEGVHTLLIKVGPDGKYQGREDLLTRANFQRISAGMKRTDVLPVLGPPGRTQEYKLKEETAWEWRFKDGAVERVFVVMFTPQGKWSRRQLRSRRASAAADPAMFQLLRFDIAVTMPRRISSGGGGSRVWQRQPE